MSSYEQVISAAVPSDLKVKYDSVYVLSDIKIFLKMKQKDLFKEFIAF